MDTPQAIVLGFVQGLTEFLPVSSTAHLRIVPAFLGWEDPGAAFTAVIQLGTMAAILLYFRVDGGGTSARLREHADGRGRERRALGARGGRDGQWFAGLDERRAAAGAADQRRADHCSSRPTRPAAGRPPEAPRYRAGGPAARRGGAAAPAAADRAQHGVLEAGARDHGQQQAERDALVGDRLAVIAAGLAEVEVAAQRTAAQLAAARVRELLADLPQRVSRASRSAIVARAW